MINAGRVLIIPKGEWTNLESYEMLDLVTRGDIAYIARQASVGVDPATDTQLTYWQPFGTAAKIATTTTPGLVMPDGTTVTIDATGLISANIGISDINNVTITSISNGQILQYNSSTQKWENKSLGSAASRNATSAITSGSTDLIESGAVNSLKQTLEQSIAGKLGTSDIANNLTTTTAGKVLDARQGKALNDSKADQSLLAPIQTTLVASKAYIIGEQFVYQGLLYKATAAIAQGGTITINGNCALSDDITTQIKNISKTETVSFNATAKTDTFNGYVRNKVACIRVKTTSLSASVWSNLGTLRGIVPENIVSTVGQITTGANNIALVNVETSGEIKILPSAAGAYVFGVTFICK